MKDLKNDVYKVQSIPNKGFGLIANRDVNASELIVSEEPLFRLELTEDGDILGQFDMKRQEFISPLLISTLNKLQDEELFKFFSLADSASSRLALEHGIEKDELKGITIS